MDHIQWKDEYKNTRTYYYLVSPHGTPLTTKLLSSII